MTPALTPPALPSAADSCRAALLGLAVGDALGVPVEFRSRAERRRDPVRGMRAYGTHQQPAGTWSDDASLTFCLAEAIAEGFTLAKLAENCVRWYKEAWWTPYGQVFDIGITTREALAKLHVQPAGGSLRVGGTDEYSNGNGALMRILPLAFYQAELPLQIRFQLIQDVSALTHGHVRSAVACFLYLEVARHLLAGTSPSLAYAQVCADAPAQLQALATPATEILLFQRVLSGELADLPQEAIQSSGYVLHTLEAALWCLLRYPSYPDAVLAAVNLGDDTDTTGAVTGGLAGLCYGEVGIPAEWLQVLARRGDIEVLAARLREGCGGS